MDTTVNDVRANLERLQQRALESLREVTDEATLEAWRIDYLGDKRGQVTQVMKGIGQLPKEERPAFGQLGQAVRKVVEDAFEAQKQALKQRAIAGLAETEGLDVTLPGRLPAVGQLHPTTRIIREIVDVFAGMGYSVAEGPEVEWDYYNFETLNIPADHPARDMWDTFWIDAKGCRGDILLRTHTSPNQTRVMERLEPPLRVIVPGKCYRYEAVDARHESMFYQIEGFAVDVNLTMADLKGTLSRMVRALFGSERKVRFRCDFFPFVEPGADLSMDCHVCNGAGCRVCGHSGWIEILGAGMIHPRVLEYAGYDPAKYSGFAFGMGPERIAMLKYDIDDIRLFYGNDLRFLRQLR
ncbi:MAG: phenylalanine--tRNA ligase subunit alpha [Chloroflexi bacterium]|nr:phenylalanine--tRNA ligase subunit alpha [Chloroflexota bacterium]